MEEKRDIAIKVNGLGKKYTIGIQKDGSLRGSLSSIFKSQAKKGEDFWALRGLDFEINKSEIIGVIGRNGAGKSTLLKVLSKITKPTEGRIEIDGRVASLLEVGTGFHPELTGRENIYLNGTILGMTRKEVSAKFEEIVDFSGVRKFIDTPVKRYSSGQYVRLAFAVAAHLEPEILIIDEVLAVGDSEFQKKCLGKMKNIAGQGRTVIFVSHDMAAIQKLCTKVYYLKAGQIRSSGDTDQIIEEYHTDIRQNGNDITETSREGDQEILVKNVQWFNKKLINPGVISSLEDVTCKVALSKRVNFQNTSVDIGINNARGIRVGWISTRMSDTDLQADSFVFKIKNMNLLPGEYNCTVYIETKGVMNDWIKEVFPFEISNKDYYNIGKSIPNMQGQIILRYDIEESKELN